METPGIQKKFAFSNDQNQKIEVAMDTNNNKLTLNTELNENILNKKKFTSIYSLDEVKEKNKFFFLCQSLNDVLNQIETLLQNNNSASFIKSRNKIELTIQTNMPLAPKIIFELKETEKKIEDKVEELNDYIINTEKNSEKNFALILKENKEMKEKICNLENQLSLLNLNFGILPNHYFDKIKDWIGGDKNKIRFSLIFKLKEEERDYNRYHQCVNLGCPQIFIFITENLSIFGSYCPNYRANSSYGWQNDSNAFLFSLNLDKKYPALKNQSNYHTGVCGYHFQDIEYCSFSSKKGSFGKTGTYLDKYKLEGDNQYFFIKHFLVYRVENI